MNQTQRTKRSAISLLLVALLLTACGGDNPDTLLASAKEYMAKNDNKAAIIQIKNALQSDPSQPEARFLLGKALLDSGDAAAAELELKKALDLKQAPDQVVPLLARALLQTQRFKEVTEQFANTELTTPESQADLLTSLTIAYAAQNNEAAAKAALAKALAAKPDFEPALLVQARMQAAQRDLPGALAAVDAMVAKNPANHEAWKFKGDLMTGQRDADGALAAYRKATEIRPEFFAAHAAIVSLLLQQGKTDEAAQQLASLKKIAPNNSQAIYLDAQIAYQKQDYKGADELLQQLLKAAPNHPGALQLAGAVAFQQKSLGQAETYLNKALQASPELTLARSLLISTYLRSGQPAKALSTLQPVLDKIEQDSNMLALAGEVFIQNGDAEKAEEYFAKASRLDPQDAKKRTSLALTHLVKGQESAFGELENIAAADTGTTADLALISAYLRRKEFDKALKAIDGLEKKQADSPLAANLRGQTLMAKQDLAGARKSFERALTISPVYYPAAASLARLDLAEKKPDDARKRFESMLVADPKNPQALLALADLKAATGGTPDEVSALLKQAIQANATEAAPRLRLIELHLRNRDAKQAMSVAQDAVAAIPDNASLLDALGRAQQAAGDANQAISTYNQLAALQPGVPRAHLRIAEIQAAAKNTDGAIQSLQRALEIKPDLLDAQRGLIAMHLQAERLEEALKVAKKVQEQRPTESAGYLLEGDIHASRKSLPEAITAYRGGLKKVPAAGDLAARLHAALRVSNQAGEAETFAAGWLKQQPKDVILRLHLGEQAVASKDYEKASSLYRAVIELQPNNAVALNNLAWVTGQLKGARALEYAERANRIAPNQPAFIDTWAVLLSEKGEHARARELFEQALKLQPQAAPIRLNMAKALIKAGDKAAAKKELETLSQLGDKYAAQAEVASLLKGL